MIQFDEHIFGDGLVKNHQPDKLGGISFFFKRVYQTFRFQQGSLVFFTPWGNDSILTCAYFSKWVGSGYVGVPLEYWYICVETTQDPLPQLVLTIEVKIWSVCSQPSRRRRNSKAGGFNKTGLKIGFEQ